MFHFFEIGEVVTDLKTTIVQEWKIKIDKMVFSLFEIQKDEVIFKKSRLNYYAAITALYY